MLLHFLICLSLILKSRYITFMTKVHIAKAVVFPVVIYGCEIWTVKKDESLRINAFELWWGRKFLSHLDSRNINPEYSLEGLMLKLKLHYSGHLMQRADSLEKTLIVGKIEGRRRRVWQRMRQLNGITKLMALSWENYTRSEGQGSLAYCSPWDSKELDTT